LWTRYGTALGWPVGAGRVVLKGGAHMFVEDYKPSQLLPDSRCPRYRANNLMVIPGNTYDTAPEEGQSSRQCRDVSEFVLSVRRM